MLRRCCAWADSSGRQWGGVSMPVKVSAEIKGMKEVQRQMEQAVNDLRGTPIQNAMRDATLYVTRDAKINVPVDTGRLRSSITPEVSIESDTVQGVVGSNVTYAPYVELGTRPHWPPIAALEVWARRHHTSAFLVARAIAQRGTPAREFLQKAFETNKDKIERRLHQAVEGIINKANG